jgi:uncharacterized protein YjlB
MIPNNEHLPLLVYENAIRLAQDDAVSIQNIARVPMHSTDPVYGAEGPLRTAWQGK